MTDKISGSALKFIGIYENGGDVPEFETKKTEQYSRQGVNLRDLITSQAGGDDEQSFQKYLKTAGVSRRDQKRLSKAYNTVRTSGLDYILSEDGSGFNVFDKETGAAQTRSSRATGSTKGVNLADLVRLGDNVSKLAGFAAQGLGEYGKDKKPITDTEPRGLPASKTSDVNAEDPEIDLVNYQPPATGGTRGPASGKKQGAAPPAKGNTTIVDDAYKRSQDLIMNRNAPSDPMSMWGGLSRNPAQVHQDQVDSTRIGGNVDEQKLAEHMKGIRGQFEKRLVGMGGFTGFTMGPGSVSSNAIKANTKAYADRAAAIYEAMVREGFNPDIEEISSLIQNDELEQISKGLGTNLNIIGTVMTLGRLGPFALRGGAGGLKSLASKYPKFAKWLASKGVAKPLQFPPTQSLPSVSKGVKEFLKGRSITGEAAKRMAREGAGPAPKPSRFNWDWMSERIGEGFEKGGKIAIQNSIDAAAQKVENFHGAPTGKLFSIKSLMGI